MSNKTDAAYAALSGLVGIGPSRTVRELRRRGDEGVFICRWPPCVHLFGVPVSLLESDRDQADGAGDLDDWVYSVQLWLWEDIDNFFRFRARRRQVDDYIELRTPTWPNHEGYYIDVVFPQTVDDPGSKYAWRRVPDVASAGLNAEVALAAQQSGELIAWVTGYVNDPSALPYVSQAIVVWEAPGVARLDFVEVEARAHESLLVDTVRAATHVAADAGAVRVVSDLPLPHQSIMGFRPDSAGRLSVDTTFLDEQPDEADRLLQGTQNLH